MLRSGATLKGYVKVKGGVLLMGVILVVSDIGTIIFQ